jgi:uncharacterized protein YndB with AHSA1/START domain
MPSFDFFCTIVVRHGKESGKMDDPLRVKAIIPAAVEEVWRAWTTEEGARAFFAPECHIDLRPGGAYEMYFDLEAPLGLRGGEGCVFLAIEPLKMLSFTWNAPPEIPLIRMQRTHVTIGFESVSKLQTHITLQHDGWGTGADWLSARKYFKRAWSQVVIPRLIQRFVTGPINWNN